MSSSTNSNSNNPFGVKLKSTGLADDLKRGGKDVISERGRRHAQKTLEEELAKTEQDLNKRRESLRTTTAKKKPLIKTTNSIVQYKRPGSFNVPFTLCQNATVFGVVLICPPPIIPEREDNMRNMRKMTLFDTIPEEEEYYDLNIGGEPWDAAPGDGEDEDYEDSWGAEEEKEEYKEEYMVEFEGEGEQDIGGKSLALGGGSTDAGDEGRKEDESSKVKEEEKEDYELRSPTTAAKPSSRPSTRPQGDTRTTAAAATKPSSSTTSNATFADRVHSTFGVRLKPTRAKRIRYINDNLHSDGNRPVYDEYDDKENKGTSRTYQIDLNPPGSGSIKNGKYQTHTKSFLEIRLKNEKKQQTATAKQSEQQDKDKEKMMELQLRHVLADEEGGPKRTVTEATFQIPLLKQPKLLQNKDPFQDLLQIMVSTLKPAPPLKPYRKVEPQIKDVKRDLKEIDKSHLKIQPQIVNINLRQVDPKTKQFHDMGQSIQVKLNSTAPTTRKRMPPPMQVKLRRVPESDNNKSTSPRDKNNKVPPEFGKIQLKSVVRLEEEEQEEEGDDGAGQKVEGDSCNIEPSTKSSPSDIGEDITHKKEDPIIKKRKLRSLLLWYNRMDTPCKEEMKRRVAMLPESYGISPEDIDELPWRCGDKILDGGQMKQYFIEPGDDDDPSDTDEAANPSQLSQLKNVPVEVKKSLEPSEESIRKGVSDLLVPPSNMGGRPASYKSPSPSKGGKPLKSKGKNSANQSMDGAQKPPKNESNRSRERPDKEGHTEGASNSRGRPTRRTPQRTRSRSLSGMARAGMGYPTDEEDEDLIKRDSSKMQSGNKTAEPKKEAKSEVESDNEKEGSTSSDGPSSPVRRTPQRQRSSSLTDLARAGRSSNDYKRKGKKEGAKENLTNDKRRSLLMWYNRMQTPNKKEMKRRVALLPESCDITSEDVEALPWLYGGRLLDVRVMNRYFLEDWQGAKKKDG